MKNQQKLTVTLSMVWIGAMMLLSTPAWARAALDFVKGSTATVASHGGTAGYAGDTTGVTHGH